jgi:cysteine synthase A
MLCTLDVVVLNLHCVVGYYQPPQGNQELIDEIVLVSEGEAFEQCRELARTEGLLVGISASAAVFAAREVAARPENAGKMVVVILCDSGERYLSVSGLFKQ